MENFYSILIVEDVPIQAKKLQYVLKKFGYKATLAENGVKALEILPTDNFSLIISDYQMPEMDGLQLLQVLKKDEKYKMIPFILLTTTEDEEVILSCLRYGANEILNKSYRAEELEIRCKNMILLYEYQSLVEAENKNLTEELMKKKHMLEYNLQELKNTHEQLQKTQEQLIQASKKQSLGTLGTGMAHEINNPLTIIKTCNRRLTKYLDEKVQDEDKMMKINTTIEGAVDRIMKIVKHLKTFSEAESAGSMEPELLNPEEILHDLADFFGGLVAKNGIMIKSSFATENYYLLGHRHMIEQALLNLIHNGIDAMESSENKILEFKTYLKDEKICIEIADSGTGIPDAIKDRIYDPFFTTKAPNKGMGMGMGLVKSYVETNDGEISFVSAPGRTVFTLTFKIESVEENPVRSAA